MLCFELHKEYIFAYPEDYSQSSAVWESNILKTKAQHPSFEIIFVYNEEESLDIYAPPKYESCA